MTDYAQTALVRSLGFLAETQAAIANNLANVDTTGFKRRAVVAGSAPSFASQLQDMLPTVVPVEGIDWQLGSTHETGNHLDVSLGSDTFLRVRDGAGKVLYTRNGKLQVDRDGYLSTQSGLRYLDTNGSPLRLDAQGFEVSSLAISPTGELTDERNGQTFGQLAIVRLPDPRRLRAVGAGLYADPGGQQPLPAQDGLRQGYEEGSNVDSLQEMVQMIVVQRSFAAAQRALGSVGRMHDSLVQNLNR